MSVAEAPPLESTAPPVALEEISTAPAIEVLDAEKLQDIRASVEHFRAIRATAVSCTSAKQWQGFGDSVYLQGDGGLTIAACFGLKIEEPEVEWVEIEGGASQCICYVTVGRDGRMIRDHGDCDSFDEFLAKRREELHKNGANREQVEQIIRSDMQKKALANALSRAVSGWTGLRGLSWEDLEALGLNLGKVDKVKFAKGSKGGKAQSATLHALSEMAVGSRANIVGVVTGGYERTGTKGDYCDISVRDETAELSIRLWSAKPDFVTRGASVAFSGVKVGEYQSRRQYVAKSVELCDAQEGGDDGNATADDNASK